MIEQSNFWSDPQAFQENYWPMLYSVTLAVLDKTAGLTATSIHVFHSMLFVGVVIGIWWLLRLQNSWTRIATVLLLLVSPPMIISVRNTGYEMLLTFFITTALILVVALRANELKSVRWRIAAATLAGLSIGFATLTNSRSLLIGIVILIFLVRKFRAPAIAFVCGASLPLVLWSIRNFIVMGQSSFLTTNGPINVWIGSNPEATTGGYMSPPVTPLGYVRGSIEFMFDDPAKFVELFFRRTTFFWGPAGPEIEAVGAGKIFFVWFGLFSAVLIFLGFLGWWFARFLISTPTLERFQLPAWAIFIYFLGSLPFLMLTRYRFPLDPMLIAIAVPTLIFYWQSWRKNSTASESHTQIS